jgi:AraC-like DNA-binding protein
MQQNLLFTLPYRRDRYAIPNYPYFLTQKKAECIADVLNRFMQDEMPFLKTGYCIRTLADDIDIPAYQVSAYINQSLGVNFNEFFNWFRVKHCLHLMQNRLTDQLNLSGLAYKCGFNNRNTLTTAFKKFTGRTPSEFTRSVSRGNQVDIVMNMNWGVMNYKAPEQTI